ncbi:MAG: beta-propeller fold lactonase family protein [Candidatus Binatia bacterium]
MKDIVRGLVLTILMLGIVGWSPGVGGAEILLNLESPAENQSVSGVGVISGWAFSTERSESVTVRFRIDGVIEGGEIPCCVERGDVAQAYPEHAGSLRSGFGVTVNFNLLADGQHTVFLEVEDSAGNIKIESRTFLTSRPGGFEFLSELNLGPAEEEVEWDVGHESFTIKGAVTRDKATEATQEVNIRMEWQANTQSLGIVDTENVGNRVGGNEGGEDGSGTEGDGGTTDTGEPPAISLKLENPDADILNTATPTLGGVGVVSGWAFSGTTGARINSVRLRVDGEAVGEIPCCGDRGDVAAAFPDIEEALRSGFGALFNFNLLESGEHLFAVEVQDSTGVTQNVEKRVTTAKLGDSEFLDEFDLSDATASILGDFLTLEKVRIRDKATQQSSEVTADYVWVESCQCFVLQQGCGNGTAEAGEECDGLDLEGESCSSFGLGGGLLSCRARCEVGDKDCFLPCFFEVKDCQGRASVYVTNVGSNSISVIDGRTNEVRATVKVGRAPRGVAVSPNGDVVYVANFDDDSVSVISAETDSVVKTILVGKGPVGLAVSRDGERVYVVNGLAGTVSVIATKDGVVEDTIEVKGEPQAIALTPDGGQGYVTNFADDSVSVLDLRANTVSTRIFVGKGPNGVAVSPDGERVYVVNFSGDSVSVIERGELRVVETIAVGLAPTKVVFSSDGKLAYVSNSLSLSISVIDAETLRISDVLSVAASPTIGRPDGIGLIPGGQRLYVALFGGGLGSRLQILSTITPAIIADIGVGEGPFAVAVGIRQ